jgi:hypothetical protein
MSRNVKITPTGTIYLFSGLLICPKCGHKLYGHRYNKNDKNIRYHCCSRNLLYGGKCGYTSIKEANVEAQLLDKIKLFANHQKHAFKRQAQNIDGTKKALKKLENKLERIKELYIDGDIDKDTYATRKENITEDIKSLKAILDSTESQTLDTVLTLNIREMYEALNKPNRSAFWHKFIDKIIIDSDNNIIDVVFHANIGQ